MPQACLVNTGPVEADFISVTVSSFVVLPILKRRIGLVLAQDQCHLGKMQEQDVYRCTENVVIGKESCIFDKSYAVFADEVVTSHGPIEADKENIRQEPYSLPQGFMWDTLDLSNADVVSTLSVSEL